MGTAKLHLKHFTEHHEVVNMIYDLKEAKSKNPENYVFSDVVDAEGHEYVDLVQEGGGMLGIALLGYTYVMEQMGIRFFSLAGTSAGAINTIFLAAVDKPSAAKSEAILQLIMAQDMGKFVDGDEDATDFIDALVNWKGLFKALFKGFQILDNLKEMKGLNPGDYFENWIGGILKTKKILTTDDLMKNLNAFPSSLTIEQKRRDDEVQLSANSARLAIVAADITTETKAVFPDKANLYYAQPGKVNPAEYVRASMSIPLFYAPKVIKNLPKGKEALIRWNREAAYFGPIPSEVHLVDGGIMSNFPIDVFHTSSRVPTRPTFGVKLGLKRRYYNTISNYRDLLRSCFTSASHIKDIDFIVKNPDYRNLVSQIDVGDHDWLNFNMSNEAKIDLFIRGARAAKDFLNIFAWANYKEIRKKLMTQ